MSDYNVYSNFKFDTGRYTGIGGGNITETQLKQPSNSYAFLLITPANYGSTSTVKYNLISYGFDGSEVYNSASNQNQQTSLAQDSFGNLNEGKILSNVLLNEIVYGGVLYTEYALVNIDYYGKVMFTYYKRRFNIGGNGFSIQKNNYQFQLIMDGYSINNYSLKSSFVSVGNRRELNGKIQILFPSNVSYISDKTLSVGFGLNYNNYISDELESNGISLYVSESTENEFKPSYMDYGIKRIFFGTDLIFFAAYGERLSEQQKFHFMIISLLRDNNYPGPINMKAYPVVPYEVTEDAGNNMWFSPDLKWIFFVNKAEFGSKDWGYGKGLLTVNYDSKYLKTETTSYGYDTNAVYHRNDSSSLELRNAVANKYVLDIIFNKNGSKIIVLCNSQKGRFNETDDNFKSDYVEGIQPDSMYCFILAGNKWKQLNLNGVGMSELWNNYNNSGTSGMGYRPAMSFDYNTEDIKTGISYVYPARSATPNAYYAQLTFGD